MKSVIFAAALLLFPLSAAADVVGNDAKAVLDCIRNAVGTAGNVDVKINPDGSESETAYVVARKGKLSITANTPVAACYAFGRYLRLGCSSMVTWGGKHIAIPKSGWPDYEEEVSTDRRLRTYMNVCTFGYSAPYWDWDRWSQEIDWMALHGLNFPLASVASEAIARRVWLRLGLTEEEIGEFFTGPAFLPWHRMGNIVAYQGPLDEEWHDGQIALQHKILDKMRALGIEPVAPAFAGFVPAAYIKKNPSVKARRLSWGSFQKQYNARILMPESPEFIEIGKLYIEEWEKEFGKTKYFISDSFNEMRLPMAKDDYEGQALMLQKMGKTIFKSIMAGDPDAVWVTQGWTFGNSPKTWTRLNLSSLLSGIPDDKMVIIDLANEFPQWIWHRDPAWVRHSGYYDKRWIYCYVPNFGGKVTLTGDLQLYASGLARTKGNPDCKDIIGCGFAPEGIENNEVVYELLSDTAWSRDSIDLDSWIPQYCRARYGFCDENVIKAWNCFRKSVYGSFYSYPRFNWQTLTTKTRRPNTNSVDETFREGVKHLLDSRSKGKNSQLFTNDAVEFTGMWLAKSADLHYDKATALKEEGRIKEARTEFNKAVSQLESLDRLLSSHPLLSLQRWVDFARANSSNPSQQDVYERDAKRLITVWGGHHEDYACRLWSGLIGSYYIPRLKAYFDDKGPEAVNEWEENWIKTCGSYKVVPYANPLSAAANLFSSAK